MIETLVVVFREGLEAFLVVAIMLAYLSNTGRKDLKRPVYLGIFVALIISVSTGWFVSGLAENPLWEGVLSIIAGLLVATFTLYVMKTAKSIRTNIGKQLEKSANKSGIMAVGGIFIFTVLMISREGMETALMLGTISAQGNAVQMGLGAALAIILVVVVGYLWVTQSKRINLPLFLQVTGAFLVLFSVYLFMYGLHELSEMNYIPFIGEDANISFHMASEVIETPLVSNLISLFLVGVPILWLVVTKYRRDSKTQA